MTETEILIRTYVTSVTTGDFRVQALRMPAGFGLIGRLVLGLTKPRQPILCSELSGVAVSLGNKVIKFKIGDEVILYTGTKLRCHTELKAISQDGPVIRKPKSMSFHEATSHVLSLVRSTRACRNDLLGPP